MIYISSFIYLKEDYPISEVEFSSSLVFFSSRLPAGNADFKG